MAIQLRFLLVLMGWAIIATGCSGTARTPAPTTSLLTSTPTSTQTLVFTRTQRSPTSSPSLTNSPTPRNPTPTATPSRTGTATLTPTGVEPANNSLKNLCKEVLPVLPTDTNPQGFLVIWSPDYLSLMDFHGKELRNIPGLISYPATSPDGKWLAYDIILKDLPEMLIVESADGQKRYQTPTGQGWLTFNRGFWLDNHQLWFAMYPLPGQITPIVVLNPFTGEQQEYPSDYPGVKRYQVGFTSGPGLHFGYSSVVIDPSLNLVIYPQYDEKEGYFISLWDRPSQKVLVRLLDDGSYGNLPLWLPDISQFVVVARPDWDSPKEWFIVSRDGQQIRQLTHFGEQFSNFEIQNNGSISPDGHYLAFGLSLPEAGNDALGSGNLVILDLETSAAENTCIPIWDGGVTVWSPDSRYLVVGEPWADDNTPSPVIMLDMEQGWAAKVAEGWRFSPAGWMISP